MEEEIEIKAAARQRMQHPSYFPNSRDRHSGPYDSRKDLPERDWSGRLHVNEKARQMKNENNGKPQYRRTESSDVNKSEELGAGSQRPLRRFRTKESKYGY